jgi:uncharacterized SAM-dependent methyltransferase
MCVNDLLFKELIKRSYRLEGRTRVWEVSDSKLWYLTPKQAQGFLDLSKTEGYKDSIIKKEVGLIKKHMKDFVKDLESKSCNIIDLGCGDGKKASLFIDELKNHIKIRYCPIDISSYMVSKAAEEIRNIGVGEVLEFRWNISDFENLSNITPLFRERGFNTHFMMLLGNTLGNFDRKDILHGIKNSMNEEDVLIIGNGLANSQGMDWVNEYKDEMINKWLIEIPRRLGLDENDVEYDVRYVDSRIEELYVIKKDKVVEHLDRKVEFKKGDRIITAISYKYTKEQLKNILGSFFSRVEIFTDDEGTYAVAVCRK